MLPRWPRAAPTTSITSPHATITLRSCGGSLCEAWEFVVDVDIVVCNTSTRSVARGHEEDAILLHVKRALADVSAYAQI